MLVCLQSGMAPGLYGIPCLLDEPVQQSCPQLINATCCVQRAREQRIARQRAQVDRQLAEKLERDRAEEAEREAKGDLRLAVRPRIDAWQANKKVLQHASPAMSRPPSLSMDLFGQDCQGPAGVCLAKCQVDQRAE